MRAGAIHPRPEQVAELTRGIEVPLPGIGEVHLEVLAEGLIRAFRDVRQSAPNTVASGSEVEVTALMETRLNRLIEEDGVWGQLVVSVARGKESISYDGSHLEKRPDLSIFLSDRTRVFPLITEAKILDGATGKGEARYCDDGVRRFVEGEYAWGSREAFMVGYVRDGSSIGATLRPFLSVAMAQLPPGYLVEELPVIRKLGSCDVGHSRHGRAFCYCNEPPSSSGPGPITVWHLWLS